MTARVTLTIGVLAAGGIYWNGSRKNVSSDGLATLGFKKSEERQMGMLYGKQGEMIERWSNSLKQPGTQAMLVISVSLLLSGVCLYCARLSEATDSAPDNRDNGRE